MRDIDTADNGGANYFETESFDRGFDGEGLRRPRNAAENAPESDLTRYRWRSPKLTPGEERDLLRAAQAGDARAKGELIRRFHRLILKISRGYHGPSRDDLIAAGALGLVDAIERFDMRRNTGLAAYAQEYIRNGMREEAKAWRTRGQAGETRADRWLYQNPGATAEQVAAVEDNRCTLEEAEIAVQRHTGFWQGHEHYDTTEADDLDDDERRRTVVVADVLPTEIDVTGATVTDADWDYVVRCRARSYEPDKYPWYRSTPEGRSNARDYYEARRQPIPRWTAHEPDLALKPISRDRYAEDQAAAHRCGKLNGLARVVNIAVRDLADASDRRDARRLKAIGRRAYALELVERDRKRIAARKAEAQYAYKDTALNSRAIAEHAERRHKELCRVEQRLGIGREWFAEQIRREELGQKERLARARATVAKPRLVFKSQTKREKRIERKARIRAWRAALAA